MKLRFEPADITAGRNLLRLHSQNIAANAEMTLSVSLIEVFSGNPEKPFDLFVTGVMMCTQPDRIPQIDVEPVAQLSCLAGSTPEAWSAISALDAIEFVDVSPLRFHAGNEFCYVQR